MPVSVSIFLLLYWNALDSDNLTLDFYMRLIRGII